MKPADRASDAATMRPALLLAFALLALAPALLGCRNDKPAAAEKPRADSAAEASAMPSESLNAEPASEPAAGPASTHVSRIRFAALPSGQFPEVVPENGARHGFATILESLGSGVAAVDVDRDGWPDALIAGGGDFESRKCVGRPIYLLRNSGGGFRDATNAGGIPQSKFYHHGLTVGDFDHDGFDDVLVVGYGGMQLFVNEGDGSFSKSRSAAVLVPGGWSASAAWADINGDGHLDLFITGYVDWSFDNDPPCFAADGVTRDNCSPKIFNAIPDSLLLSNADGSFRDESTSFGVRSDGKALGVVAADLNADGTTDVYVGNDVMVNFLYRNDDGKTLTDWSVLGGAAGSRRGSPDASMGVDVMDFNNDGRFDLWAANFEMESFALYQGQGNLQFRHVSDITGISAIGDHYVGWGTAFTDLDLDGDCDVVVCNGNVVQHPRHSATLQKMVLLENIDGTHFEEVTDQAGEELTTPRHGRGLAWTDWNRDGRVDLLTSPTHAPAVLLQNNSAGEGRGLTVKLVGTNSARHPIGSIVTLNTSAGNQTRQLIGGGSYASTSLAELHFGIPEGVKATSLSIRWPSRTESQHVIDSNNSHITVIEKQGEVLPWPR